MLSWGKKPQAPPDSYQPLIESEQVATPSASQSEPPIAGKADQVKWVKQWLLDCTGEEGTEVLEAISEQRPELILKTRVVEAAQHEERKAKPQKDAATVIDVAPSPRHTLALSPRSEAIRLLPILQFSTSYYYCLENEHAVEIEVLRLNNSDGRTQVTYTTMDKSAHAGHNYVAKAGLLVFEPGETLKTICIELIDDSAWGGVLEFLVVLEEERLTNAVLSEHISVARIQRIDDDAFPSNKYKEEILSRRVDEINVLLLFMEYCKLCLTDPVIRSGTIKTILIGQMKNIFTFFKLFTSVYLIDHVLSETKPDDEPDKWLFINKHWSLVAYIMVGLVPLGVSHLADYRKFSWRVGGKARMGLSKGLVNSFLHIDESCRGEVDEGLLHETMTHDTEALIKVGYSNFVNLFALMGQILLFILFQVGAPLATGSSRAGVMILQMSLFPIMIAIVLSLRSGVTRKTLKRRRDADRALSRHIHEMVANYGLLKDYKLRHTVMDRHENLLMDVNAADKAVGETLSNNTYMMKWLTFIAVSLYVLNGGMAVINGDLRLGLYLTMTKVFIALGAKWSEVYKTILTVFNSAPALERIVHFINLPTDARRNMEITRDARSRTVDLLHQPLAAGKTCGSNFNVVPIELTNLTVTLRALTTQGSAYAKTRLFYDKLVIEQGTLVSVVGRRGHGKSTLLKILGGNLLPDSSNFEEGNDSTFFIPSHLRCLHVATEPSFLRGGLYQNLTFGAHPGHPDARVDRVQEICGRLEISSKLIDAMDPNSKDEFSWSSSLSSSEKHLLCIARALIANPEVLCVHKPTLQVNAHTAEIIIKILREFVDNRGIAQEGPVEFRRPRTCILTSTRALSMSYADAIFQIDDGSVTKVDSAAVGLDQLC